jgi:hypothetical protein
MAEHFGALSLPVGEFLALEHGTEFVGYTRIQEEEVTATPGHRWVGEGGWEGGGEGGWEGGGRGVGRGVGRRVGGGWKGGGRPMARAYGGDRHPRHRWGREAPVAVEPVSCPW